MLKKLVLKIQKICVQNLVLTNNPPNKNCETVDSLTAFPVSMMTIT